MTAAPSLLVEPERPVARAAQHGVARLVFLGLLVLALVPVLLVDIPAGVDVPNHLARMELLAQAERGDEHPYYVVRWALYPNLALDLVVPALGQLVGVPLATKLFYLVSMLLIIAGAVALEVAHKRRVGLSGFVALGVLYSVPFAWGFLNSSFALGISLWVLP